jgi:WD40 repeat protein
VGRHEPGIGFARSAAIGDRLVSIDREGRDVRVWTTADGEPRLERVLERPRAANSLPGVSRDGRRVAIGSVKRRSVFSWDLEAPPDARPTQRRLRAAYFFRWPPDFHPDGDWLMGSTAEEHILWLISDREPHVLPAISAYPNYLIFTPESDRLLGGWGLWPLTPEAGPSRQIDYQGVAISPDGRCVATCLNEAVRLDCGTDTQRVLIDDGLPWAAVAFAPDGRSLAVATYEFRQSPEDQLIRIIDLESGLVVRSIATIEQPQTTDQGEGQVEQLVFTPDGRLLSAGWGGVRFWNLDTGIAQWLFQGNSALMSLSADGRLLLVGGYPTSVVVEPVEELRLLDLSTGSSRRIVSHGGGVTRFAIDPTGRFIATGSADGAVRVGPTSEDREPQLLLGHEGPIIAVAFSPDGRWVASAGRENIRLWPMPDVSKPPLHTLPHDELLAKLETLTNLRVVRDEESSTGWELEVGPFPGWQDVPTW